MAQDFYRRAQILHEEFQKRELHYLNAEKKWNNLIWKKDIDMPLQEYLQKLDRREMETEETYKNLMKQMEELDKHTDLMSLKLERLGILQSNIKNIGTSNWLHTLTGSNSLSLEAANQFQTSTNLNLSAKSQFLKPASTQTENKFYCEKCRSEISVLDQPQFPVEAVVSLTAPKFQSSACFSPEIIHPSKFLNSVISSNEINPISQLMASPIVPEQSYPLPNNNKSISYGYKNIEQANPKSFKHIDSSAVTESPNFVMDHNLQNTVSFKHDIHSDNLTEHDSVVEHNSLQSTRLLEHNSSSGSLLADPHSVTKHNLLQSTGLPNHDVNSGDLIRKQSSVKEHNLLPNTSPAANPQILENINTDVSKSLEVAEVDSAESMSKRNNETEKPYIVDNDASVSKSDEGSINHEFDFLESDAANVLKDSKSQAGLKMARSRDRSTSARPDQNHFSVKSKSEEQDTVASKHHMLGDIVDKSDTSGPQTPSIHSANLSLASDSDSIGGKESPLKASAAYQALLGNTTILEKRTKQYSESESEDDIENVLANAVRKNSQILPKPKQDAKNTQLKKDEKPGVSQAESKPINKSSKPSLASKPQSKLSKSTRKVLGLETSSGSEVEVAAKPPGKKIEEDSDEFDFFD